MARATWRVGAASLAFLAASCLAAVWGPPAATAATRQTIFVYGDSLSWQAGSYFEHDFSTATTINEAHVFPGTAVCTWLPDIKSLTRADAPTVVVLEFVGNVSNCDGSVTSPTALANAYKADLKTAIDALLTVAVHTIVVDEGPRTDCTAYAYCAAQSKLHDAFKQVVSSFDSKNIVYAGLADRAVETPSGRFTRLLPCLAAEVRARLCAKNALITVRSADGVHFCPVPNTSHGVMMPCPVYASGAYRFATGFANSVWMLDPATKPRSGTTTP